MLGSNSIPPKSYLKNHNTKKKNNIPSTIFGNIFKGIHRFWIKGKSKLCLSCLSLEIHTAFLIKKKVQWIYLLKILKGFTFLGGVSYGWLIPNSSSFYKICILLYILCNTLLYEKIEWKRLFVTFICLFNSRGHLETLFIIYRLSRSNLSWRIVF